MVSRIDLGPDGGPYVEIDEDAGDLVIRVPNDTVDFDSNDLLNAVLQNATMDGGSLDGVSLASALDADTQEIQNANLQNATLSDALDANNQDLNSVGTASVTSLEAGGMNIENSPVLVSSNGWKWGFDGDSVDDRLDNALTEASDGDTIYLEPRKYNNDRTINKKLEFRGSNVRDQGTDIDAVWTMEDRAEFHNVHFRPAGTTFKDQFSALMSCCFFGEIIIEGDGFRIIGCSGQGSVTFASGTSGGVIDGCTETAVTDNGDNTIGDLG